MKQLFLLLFFATCLLAGNKLHAQLKVGNNPTVVHPSGVLEAESTTKGFLPPRMTQMQRTSVTSPATGLLVYQSDAPAGFWYFNGVQWVRLIAPVQTSTSYVGFVDIGDITVGTTIAAIGGVVVSATKSNAGATSTITVTHNLALTGQQHIHITNRGLTGSPDANNDMYHPPIVFNVTANSFQVLYEEFGSIQDLRMMFHLANY